MASAGRILIIPKGDYSDQTTYTNLDLVFYNNTSWLCRKECKGVKPSSATSEYWFRFSAIALANNLTTNADGYALDAKQGVVIKTNLDNLSLAINGLSDDVSALAASIDTLLSQNVAAIYDASKTYAAGDYVVYNNKLYECKTDVTVPEEFDSSKWTETYIMTSIDARVDAVLDQILDTKLSGIKGMIANEYRNDITYDVGAIVSYNGNLYKCIEDVTLAEEFDSSKWEETTMSDNIGGDAAGITYDNAKSRLKSNNVQGAVDELSSSLTCRYNPETDKIQVFYNNQWIDAVYARIQSRYIYTINEVPVINDWLTMLSGKDADISTASVSSDGIMIRVQGTTNASIVYNEKIDFSNYSRLRIKYRVSWMNPSASGQTGSASIGISLDMDNNFDFIDGYSILYSTQSNTAILEKVIDITSLTSSGYVKMSARHTGSYAIYLDVYEISLEV